MDNQQYGFYCSIINIGTFLLLFAGSVTMLWIQFSWHFLIKTVISVVLLVGCNLFVERISSRYVNEGVKRYLQRKESQ